MTESDPTAMLTDPAVFRRVLRLPAPDHRLADFQRRDFAALDPAFVAVATGRMPACRRYWLERTKGASKDSDLATLILWLLLASRRPLVCQVAAADADQADELRRAASGMVRSHADFFRAAHLEVQSDRIVNTQTGAVCDILAADVAGSHGARPDLLILNELTHVTRREFVDNLLDNAEKIASGVVVVATNAGFRPSWQWTFRESIRTSPRWYFSTYDRPAPWIDQASLEERRRSSTPSRFNRLWRGVWSSGGGDALEPADVDAALTCDGPMTAAEPGWVFAAGLDIGLKRDASALVVSAVHVGWSEPLPMPEALPLPATIRALIEVGELEAPPEPDPEWIIHPALGRIRVAAVRVWKPRDSGGKVSLEEVEEAAWQLHQRFGLACLNYDPWQGAYLAERLAKRGVPVEGVPFVPAALRDMAQEILEAFTDRNVDLFADDDLIADLRNLRIVERSYGMRLESPRGPEGHGDSATGLALSLLGLRRCRGGPSNRVEGPLLCWPA